VSAAENHPAVEYLCPSLAAAARPDSDRGRCSLDHLAKANILLILHHEAGKAHRTGLVRWRLVGLIFAGCHGCIPR
jgi:hypothetical protein